MQRRVITPRFGQAQDLAGIDRENPITQGLFNGFLHPASSLRGDLVTGALAPSVTDRGLAFVSASSSNTAVFQGRFSPQSSAATWLVLARRDGTQPDSGFGMAVAVNQVSGTQDPFHLFIKTSGERFRVNTVTDDSTASWETNTDWVVGQWMVGVYTWASGGTPTAYRNGVLQTLSLNSGTKTGSLKPSNTTTINLAALRLNGAVGGFLVWDRVLTADEIRAVSLNPWQVVAKRRRFVNVGPSGILSSADPGSFTVSGVESTATKAWVSSADAGSVSVSGFAATGVKSTISAADTGSLVVSGSSATGLYNRASSANSGSLSITGFAATGILPQISNASPGTYVLTGFDATASTSRVSAANAGSFAITGFAATALYAAWPDPSDVRAGVMYGPTGTEYTGTLVAGVAAGSFLDVSTGRRVLVANGVAVTL